MPALLVALACAALPAHATPAHHDTAQGFRFHIVTGDDSAQTRHIADDLYQRLASLAASFRTELAQRRRLVYIAIGPAALRDCVRRQEADMDVRDSVIISAFTASQVVQAVAAGARRGGAPAITAVYAEPAPADQLRLIELLYRRPVKVAAIVGADTQHLKSLLRTQAPAPAQVAIDDMAPGEDINRVLNRIGPAEVLLAMPDSAVYNTDTVRNILLSTYRHKQGVIGFSADMVKAGALATTYSDIEDIDAQVAEMAHTFASTGELPAPQFPRYFHTIVNDGVARSLDLDVSAAARRFARRAPTPAP